jgi:hypothetical protein
MARGGREVIASVFCFAAVIGALFFMDPRVRVQMGSFVDGGVAPWRHRASDLANTLWLSLRDQSLENGTFVLFAVVGFLLFLFMLKT